MKLRIWKVKSWRGLVEEQMRKVTFVVTLAIILSSSMIGRAQSTTSQVNGTVTDSTGAIVIGASITIANTATGLVYHALTDGLGAYHITNLPPGSYTMDVIRAGFAAQHILAWVWLF
jgi:hypothetical protein